MRNIFFLFFISATIHGQNYKWDWAIGTNGSSDEFANDIKLDKNENIFLSGNYSENSLYYDDCLSRNGHDVGASGFIIQINKTQDCNCLTDFLMTDFINMVTDSDGNIYFITAIYKEISFRGFTYISKFNTGSSILVKLDSNCNIKWIKEFGDKNKKSDLHAQSIAIDAMDNIILSGNTSADTVDFGGQLMIKPPTIKHNSIFLVKFNSDGETIWLNSSKLANSQYITRIQIDHESNIIIAGNISKAFGTSDVSLQFDDIKVTTNGATYQSFVLLYKFTPEGKAIWGKIISGTDDIDGAEIAVDSKDNIILSASFYHEFFVFGKDTLKKKNLEYFTNYLLLKYDKNGNEIWAKNLEAGKIINRWFTLKVDQDDQIWCHVNFTNQDFRIGQYLFSSKGGNDNALIRYSKDGDPNFAYSYGSKGSEFASDFVILKDGSLVVTGDYDVKEFTLGNHTLINEGEQLSNGRYPRNIFLARFAPDSLVSNQEIKKVDMGYSVYPNPASDYIVVSSKEDINDIKTIELYNLEGNRSHIKFKKESSNKMSFSGKALLDGVYLLKILTDDGVENIKIQIQH